MTEKKKTRFSGIADKRGQLPVEPEPELDVVQPEPPPAPAPMPAISVPPPAPVAELSPAPVASAATAVSAPPPAPVVAKVRQPGKKDNPDYVQVTVYLRKDIYKTARKLLIDDGRQVSELVDDLVSSWISTRAKSYPNQ